MFPAKGAGLLHEQSDIRTCHFQHSFLKANKVSKTERDKDTAAKYQKLSKLVRDCRNYTLPKLPRFSETPCICIQTSLLYIQSLQAICLSALPAAVAVSPTNTDTFTLN